MWGPHSSVPANARICNSFCTIDWHMPVNAISVECPIMIILNAVRDFAEGLARGMSLFFTERHDFVERSTMPGRIRRG